MKFTRPTVAGLSLPAGQIEAFHWDDSLPGFGVRLRATGARRFVVQYRESHGGTRRVVLGDPATVGLDDAREKAREILARARLGADPQADKVEARKAKRTLELIDDYLADAAKRMKPRSLVETTRHLRVHAKPVHQRPAVTVSRADVAELLTKIESTSGPVSANRVRSSLSALWGWAMMEGYLDGNPVAATRKRAEASRERVLTDAELRLIWDCTGDGHDHSRIVRLLLLTGLRRDEVGRAMWSELDGSLFVIEGRRTKNGLPHEVPLPALVVAQLPARRNMKRSNDERAAMFGKRAGEGFSGWSHCKKRLDARMRERLREDFAEANGRLPADGEATVAPWTLHDLRRTLATWLSEHGEEPHIVEALLNHIGGSAKRGVAGVYNRASYREQKRAALAKWAEHVSKLAGISTSNVAVIGAA